MILLFTVAPVKVGRRSATGLRVDLPEGPPLLLIVAEKGFVMCGYLNIEAAERLGVCAATVSGVKSFEDVLDAEVKAATSKAQRLGVKAGMRGKEAVELML